MSFCSYLCPDMIRLGDPAPNKKKVLETLADLFASHSTLKAQTILQLLFEREKLGSTALGKGVAVPHCRVAGLDEPLACLLHTKTGVDYDAPDDAPVSLFFALLVPESAPDEHLQLLSDLAQRLDDPACVKRLTQAPDAAGIIAELRQTMPAQHHE